MRELVGQCQTCGTPVYCEDGFFRGVVEENGIVLCFACKERMDDEDSKK